MRDAEQEAMCSMCGSGDLEYQEGEYGTGVFAPDGGEERRLWRGYRCRECGTTEEA